MAQTSLLILLLGVVQVYSQCGERIQACASTIREYEKEIQDIKAAAFAHCFPDSRLVFMLIYFSAFMCHHCINADFRCLLERAAFDQCFQRSLTATRSSLSNGHFAADSFEDIAQRYVLSLDQCFSTSNPLIIPTSDIAAILVDEDAVYARAIYGLEYADRLWQLPSGLNNPPELDRNSVCLTRQQKERLFGNGVSRIADSADPKINNLNTSCLLENTQLRCYKRYLENDQDFQHLVVNQDRALRSCIQRIRIECRNNDGSMMRACLCSAREEFENLLQASLIECVRKFGVLLSVKPNSTSQQNNVRSQSTKTLPSLSITESMDDDPLANASNNNQVTTGTLINGHCLCSYGKQSLNEFRNFLNDIKPRNEQDVPYRATRTKNKSPEQWESSREQHAEELNYPDEINSAHRISWLAY